MLLDNFIEKSWNDLGYRLKKAYERNIFVRTLPKEYKTKNGLWLAPKYHSFYGGLPHQQLVKAVTMKVADRAEEHYGIKPGEVICFIRLHFASLHKFEDGTHFGWIPAEQVAGYVDDPNTYGQVEDIVCGSKASLPNA